MYKNINSSYEKYEFFFPKKVYRCSCLLRPVQESFDHGDHSLSDIIYFIKNFEFDLSLLCDQIYCTKVGEKKENCLILCETHLIILLLAKTKFLCTATDEEKLLKISYDKVKFFCKGCVKQYMRKMYSYFFHVDFDL